MSVHVRNIYRLDLLQKEYEDDAQHSFQHFADLLQDDQIRPYVCVIVSLLVMSAAFTLSAIGLSQTTADLERGCLVWMLIISSTLVTTNAALNRTDVDFIMTVQRVAGTVTARPVVKAGGTQ